MFKRIISGFSYVGLCGAIGLGLVIAASLLTSGPVWLRIAFVPIVAAAFVLGYLAEGGGSDRKKDESADGV